MNIAKTTLFIPLILLSFFYKGFSATTHFAGKIYNVFSCSESSCTSCDNTCYIKYNVESDFLIYNTRGSLNEDTKVGVTFERKIEHKQTACFLNGRLISQEPFAKALRPGLWGIFFENAMANVYTLPDHKWGELINHDPQNNQFTLKTHKTHNSYHLSANPPEDTIIEYNSNTKFMMEDEVSDPSEVLGNNNHWIQVHSARKQMMDIRTPSSSYNPDELKKWYNGQRWHANNYTAPAVIEGFEVYTGYGGGYKVHVRRKINGKWQRDLLKGYNKAWFDGKRCDEMKTVLKPGRKVALGNVRSEQSPDHLYVRSNKNIIEGKIKEVKNNSTIVIDIFDWKNQTTGKTKEVSINSDATIWLNGQNSSVSKAVKAGNTITVYPERKRTIKGFNKYEPRGIVGDLPPLPEVNISTPDDSSSYTFNKDTINVTADISYKASSINRVMFFQNEKKIKTSYNAPHEATISDIREGNFQVWAKVIASDSTIGKSEPSTVFINKPDLFVSAKADTLKGAPPLTINFDGNADGFGCNGRGDFIEKNGMVVMEAEHFTDTMKKYDIRNWYVDTAESGYYGSGYVTTDKVPIKKTFYKPGSFDTYYKDQNISAADVIYKIDFSTSGDYHVWMRRKIPGPGANSAWLALNGDYLGYFDNGFVQPYFEWQWRGRNASEFNSYKIDTGVHKFMIRRREAQFKIDKIILTTDGSFTPSGEGPEESDTYPAGCTYHWNFGDGSEEKGKQQTHTYKKDGIYKAILTVSTATPGEKAKDTVTIRVGDPPPTGTKSPYNKTDDFKIYPTLTKGKVNIEGFQSNADVTIISSTGNIHKKTKIKNHTNNKINISKLPPGLYLIKVQTDSHTRLKKVIKK